MCEEMNYLTWLRSSVKKNDVAAKNIAQIIEDRSHELDDLKNPIKLFRLFRDTDYEDYFINDWFEFLDYVYKDHKRNRTPTNREIITRAIGLTIKSCLDYRRP